MRTFWALLGATLAGSVVYTLYNLTIEPMVPDRAVFSLKRQTPSGPVTVPYLTLDQVGAVVAISLAAVPIGAMIHKVSGGIVPAAK